MSQVTVEVRNGLEIAAVKALWKAGLINLDAMRRAIRDLKK